MAVQRYRVLERIAVGGMAEVYKGVATSLRGFEKIVAIKRVLPHLTRNRTFVRMFLDEARLSLHLNHANITQVFDVGHADDAYFIVMEYVEGIDLRDLMDVTSANELILPIEQTVFIASEMCKGLAYAHDKKDREGEALSIVHRDISPPNVLLSLQGEVKIVDFGLAKARSQIETTDPGLVKGKFGYLSPEAAYGDDIDARTDIFAVGIVLWEMLAGRRLFLGETDHDTLELVRRAKVPPLADYNPNVPPELETMVRKALARDVTLRYDRADTLGRALSQFLFSCGLEVTSYDIAALVQATAAHVDREHPPPRLDDELDIFIEEELKLISIDDEPILEPLMETSNFASGLAEPPASALGGLLEDPSDWFESPLFEGSINLSLAQIVGSAKAPLKQAPKPTKPVDVDVDVDVDIDIDFAGDSEFEETAAPRLSNDEPPPEAETVVSEVGRPELETQGLAVPGEGEGGRRLEASSLRPRAAEQSRSAGFWVAVGLVCGAVLVIIVLILMN